MNRSDYYKKSRNNFIVTFIILVIIFLIMWYLLGFFYRKFDYGNNNGSNQPVNNIIALKEEEEEEPVKPPKKDDKPVVPKRPEIPEDTFFIYYEHPESTNGINLVNQFPIKDEVGKNLEGDNHKLTFKLIFDEKAEGVNYVISSIRDTSSTVDIQRVKIYLEKEGKAVSNCLKSNKKIKTYSEYSKYQKNNDKRVIYTGTISHEEAMRGYIDFTYRMWLSEDWVITDKLDREKFITRIGVDAN